LFHRRQTLERSVRRPLSDGPNMLRIDDLPPLLRQLAAIRAAGDA